MDIGEFIEESARTIAPGIHLDKIKVETARDDSDS